MTELPDAAWRRRFRARLLRWYDRSARDLPWRATGDPYAIWLSEIMLQQTTVATVAKRYGQFLKRFPSIESLAAAREEDVLRAWEGLGYYRRARQLHRAARAMVQRHGGRFPRELEEVLALPGVGRYTAGAIVSIAFDTPAPILEANTRRVLARLLGYRGDPTSARGEQLLWSMAEALLPRRGSGKLNQALMELGALVCTPKEPLCDECPVAALCEAQRLGQQRSIPRQRAKPELTDRHEIAVIVRRRGRVLLEQCPEGGRWAGLWDFPRFDAPEIDGTAFNKKSATEATPAQHGRLRAAIVDHLRRSRGLRVELGERLTTIRHGVTRYRIRLDAYTARAVSDEEPPPDAAPRKWLLPSALEQYPLCTTGRKLAGMVA